MQYEIHQSQRVSLSPLESRELGGYWQVINYVFRDKQDMTHFVLARRDESLCGTSFVSETAVVRRRANNCHHAKPHQFATTPRRLFRLPLFQPQAPIQRANRRESGRAAARPLFVRSRSAVIRFAACSFVFLFTVVAVGQYCAEPPRKSCSGVTDSVSYSK